MPTVRVRRNTYTPLAENGGSAERPSGSVPIALGDPIGMTDLRRGSDGRDESWKSASPPLTPLDDRPARGPVGMGSSADQSTAFSGQAGPRSRSASNSLPTGRSRSRTIQSIVGDRYAPPASMFVSVQEATAEEDVQEERPNSDAISQAQHPRGAHARIEEPNTTGNAQARTRRASLIARSRGVSVSSGSGAAQVALTIGTERRKSGADHDDDDEEWRIGMASGRSRSFSNAVKRLRATSNARRSEEEDEEHHLDAVVEHLDVIDPQIGTVSSLQNCANSIMIPPMPGLWSRKPVLNLPDPSDDSLPDADERETKKNSTSRRQSVGRRSGSVHSSTQSLTAKELSEDALDKHVEHVLRKRDKAKRVLKGLWAFVKTPMGFITAVYGFLVAFWGAAIVLFLLGWINTGSDYNKKLWIEISSQVENGLFTITGVGLIPWRVMDAYRIYIIWRLKRLSAKLRKKRGLTPITNPDDLPDPALDPDFVPVLTEKQQAQLQYQQTKFMASQTWYRPHATETHRAFPISWGVAICFLMVGNSAFQCILCGCMWGLNRFHRPAWTTGSLIPLSFLCGIAAAVVIWKGGEKTKKKAEVEAKLREALGMDDEPKRSGEVPEEHNQEVPAASVLPRAIDTEKRSS